jgi:hypothetical protein
LHEISAACPSRARLGMRSPPQSRSNTRSRTSPMIRWSSRLPSKPWPCFACLSTVQRAAYLRALGIFAVRYEITSTTLRSGNAQSLCRPGGSVDTQSDAGEGGLTQPAAGPSSSIGEQLLEHAPPMPSLRSSSPMKRAALAALGFDWWGSTPFTRPWPTNVY